jgi:hypothetical protein
MHKNVKTFVKSLAAIPVVLASGLALAQAAAPTSAIALAQAVDLSDAKSAGLIIIGLLVALGVTIWGAMLVYAKFKPK